MAQPLVKIAITSGEPAGIGPDICLMSAFALKKKYPHVHFVILGDAQMLAERAQKLHHLLPKSLIFKQYQSSTSIANHQNFFTHNEIEICHIPLNAPCRLGQLDVVNAPSVLNMLDRAIEGAISQEFAAIVTAPIHKQIINKSGVDFSGHTEYLAQKTNTPLPVMLLTCDKMRVALASTHLPLSQVPSYLNTKGIIDVLTILCHDLNTKFGIHHPCILVTGLNPHAGEGGVLGREEIEIITPAIEIMQAKGFNVRGPLPADTLFTPNVLKDADAVLAMYHDQGLPVLKYASFGQGVNVTLGLPIIRTSVDHGTALDLAGTGKADCGSLMAAVELAITLCTSQSLQKT